MGKSFWTSDLHFYHRNIVSYTNRGVDTTQEEHDEWLIRLWNSQVSSEDTVYQLGDFCFNRKKVEDITRITSRLNGRIICIKGNHCSREALIKSGLEWYDLKGIWITLSNGTKQYVVLCHYALEIWERQHHGAWHLFGHSHGSFQPEEGKRVDVGLDNSYNLFGEHRFFTTQDLEKYMNKREIIVKDHHNSRTAQ